eukprot:scaffold8226_cov115-Skeletonema_dohrnii-CCMP3373.AAC.2
MKIAFGEGSIIIRLLSFSTCLISSTDSTSSLRGASVLQKERIDSLYSITPYRVSIAELDSKNDYLAPRLALASLGNSISLHANFRSFAGRPAPPGPALSLLSRGLEVEVQVAMRHKKVIVIYFQPSPILHAELMNRKTALRFAPEAMPVLASQQRQGASKGG